MAEITSGVMGPSFAARFRKVHAPPAHPPQILIVHQNRLFVDKPSSTTLIVHQNGRFVDKPLLDHALLHHIRLSVEKFTHRGHTAVEFRGHRMSKTLRTSGGWRICQLWCWAKEISLATTPYLYTNKNRMTFVIRPFSAEREGFEPPDPLRSTVFKTAAFDHSAISPICFPFRRDCKGTNNFETCKLFFTFLQKSCKFSLKLA